MSSEKKQNKCRYCRKPLDDPKAKYCSPLPGEEKSACETLRKIANHNYYINHKQEAIEKNQKFRENNPDKVKQYWRTYYESLTPEEKQKRLEDQRESKRLWAQNNRTKKKQEMLQQIDASINELSES